MSREPSAEAVRAYELADKALKLCIRVSLPALGLAATALGVALTMAAVCI